MINKFKNKKTAVIGIGVEGISSAKFLLEKGVSVSILDKKNKDQVDKEYLKQAKKLGARLVLGEKYLEDLGQFSFIVRSPGVKLDTQEIKSVIASGADVTSQIKIFFDLCPCPIIGVTGTKGKGTTASLIYEMLKKQGFDTHLGGNIGNPPLDFLGKLKKESIAVLELSSFQLQDLTKSPYIAVVLMITSEHLDYHKDTNEYVEAKRNILCFQTKGDYAIVNRDYPVSNESDIHTDAQVFKVSRDMEVEEGCFVGDGEIKLKIKNLKFKIINTEDILLPGKHNWENVCAAVMAVWLCGVSRENIIKVLKTFKGLEHRLELVREVNGVKYYDDSFSTTPETAIAAIQAFKEPEILILGGSSKGSDFRELGQIISSAKNIKAIIGIGIEWERIKKELRFKNHDLRIIENCKNMSEIVQKASQIANSGDVVLLSPACASFGIFKNYKDRGEQFKKEVNSLK